MQTNENIKKLRLRLGLSPEGFAQLLGVDIDQVTRLESNNNLTIMDVYSVANATDVNPAWIAFGTNDDSYNGKYDACLRIYSKADRLVVMGILASNGYDVGQHKAAKTKTGKQFDFFVHAKLLESNADTSR